MKEKRFNKLLIFSVVEFIAIITLAVIVSEQKHRVYYRLVKQYDNKK